MKATPQTAVANTTPKQLVAYIKAIFNQDLRERQAAGYRYGTRHLAQRVAKALGMNIHTVLAIKERRRRQYIWTMTRSRMSPFASSRSRTVTEALASSFR